MTKFKKITLVGTMVLAIGATALTAFAAPKISLEDKKANLNSQVELGIMTAERADEIIKAIEENSVNCDGTGSAKIGQSLGAKFGSNGKGQGTGGANRGQGTGRGRANGGQGLGQGGAKGQDRGLQDGSCLAE